MARSTVLILLAITWRGVQFPWSSAHALVPLIVGAVGLLVFFAIEFFWFKEPTVWQLTAIYDLGILMALYKYLAFSSQIALRLVGEL